MSKLDQVLKSFLGQLNKKAQEEQLLAPGWPLEHEVQEGDVHSVVGSSTVPGVRAAPLLGKV